MWAANSSRPNAEFHGTKLEQPGLATHCAATPSSLAMTVVHRSRNRRTRWANSGHLAMSWGCSESPTLSVASAPSGSSAIPLKHKCGEVANSHMASVPSGSSIPLETNPGEAAAIESEAEKAPIALSRASLTKKDLDVVDSLKLKGQGGRAPHGLISAEGFKDDGRH